MRNGQKQQQRMRGRNRGKSHNPLSRLYESNGPDVKIRGTAHHVAEKYLQLARDAQSSGDPVGAENYYQHAEHYFRLIATAQEQFRQAAPFYRPEGEGRDEAGGDEGEEGQGQGESMGAREPSLQPNYPPREANPYGLREPQPYSGRPHQPQQPAPPEEGGQLERLPAFITGGGGQPQPNPPPAYGNGHDGPGDRFSNRRRRRHRGPRGDMPGGPRNAPGEAGDEGPEPSVPQGD